MIKRPLVWMALAQITGIAGAVFDMMWLPSAFAIMVIISAVMRQCHDLYLSGRRSRAEKSDIAGHFGNSHCGNIITTVLMQTEEKQYAERARIIISLYMCHMVRKSVAKEIP